MAAGISASSAGAGARRRFSTVPRQASARPRPTSSRYGLRRRSGKSTTALCSPVASSGGACAISTCVSTARYWSSSVRSTTTAQRARGEAGAREGLGQRLDVGRVHVDGARLAAVRRVELPQPVLGAGDPERVARGREVRRRVATEHVLAERARVEAPREHGQEQALARVGRRAVLRVRRARGALAQRAPRPAAELRQALVQRDLQLPAREGRPAVGREEGAHVGARPREDHVQGAHGPRERRRRRRGRRRRRHVAAVEQERDGVARAGQQLLEVAPAARRHVRAVDGHDAVAGPHRAARRDLDGRVREAVDEDAAVALAHDEAERAVGLAREPPRCGSAWGRAAGSAAPRAPRPRARPGPAAPRAARSPPGAAAAAARAAARSLPKPP